MNTLSILLAIWVCSVVAFIAVMIYRAQLTRHETDQLFLSETADTHDHEAEHDDIVRKVNRIQPICQGIGGLAALTTLSILGLYIVQNLPNVQH